jgi:hypothetical protein
MAIAAVMMCVIIIFGYSSAEGAITLIFTMASYTYGPLLGMFTFGLFSKRNVQGYAIPIIAIVAPLLSYVIAHNSQSWFGGYIFSYEIIVVNAAITMLGMFLASQYKSGR